PTKTNGRGDRVFASPLARRLAKERGIDLFAIAGSGPHGRVIKADVDAAKAGKAPVAAAAAAPAAAAGPSVAPGTGDAQVMKLFEAGSYEVIPHDNVRKIIAKRLVEAKTTIPHFYLTVDTEIDALLALRSDINAAAPLDKDKNPAWKVSVNDMVIKALAMALQRVPDANVTWTEGGMLRHKHSDIGVAVAIPGGLITPVVRHAEEKRISDISNEMKDLALRARSRKLAPHEYQGGSSAVSNLGMFGIKDFAAVINPPHATILAVGAGEERPVVKKGKIEIATIMTVTLSTDHRAVDGALGSQLLSAFKALIEKPAGMLA
ncbi:MAG TPA: 2-oxo acid dehydrogenase subunit E2, partial [Bauldia sp.]|nr:2-oxo acid dehydrogenase subunit E2 [Bauldia sp.]